MISKVVLTVVLVAIVAVGVGCAVYVMMNENTTSGENEQSALRITLEAGDSYFVKNDDDPFNLDYSGNFDGTNYYITRDAGTTTVSKADFVAKVRYVGYISTADEIDYAKKSLKEWADMCLCSQRTLTVEGIGNIDCVYYENEMLKIWSKDTDFSQLYRFERFDDGNHYVLALDKSSPVDWSLVEV